MQATLRRRGLARAAVSVAACALAPRGVAGAPSPGVGSAFRDIRRYVFVPSATTPVTTIIDADTNQIVATLPIGLVARQVEVSRELERLVATDGRSASLAVVDVFEATTARIALPGPAQRLTLGTGGRIAAATDLEGGTVTLVDLVEARVLATVRDLPRLRDVMFGDRDVVLYIAAEGSPGVGIIDVQSAKVIGEIPTLHPSGAGIAALSRMPNGRRILALPPRGGPIGVLDVEKGGPPAEIDVGAGISGVFASGTGTYLLVPDTALATLAVFRSDTLRDPVVLPGEAGVTGVYSAWLDSVAFMPSAPHRRVLIYDLDTQRLAGDLALPGTPTRGAVTSDSRTLYLPVLDPPLVAAVDGETRRIVATIGLRHPPLAATVAGGWGICH